MNAPLVPLHEPDFIAEMATVLRVNGMTFDGTTAEIEDRAYRILWRKPDARAGYSHSEIQPRLTAAIEQARALGPIDLESAVA